MWRAKPPRHEVSGRLSLSKSLSSTPSAQAKTHTSSLNSTLRSHLTSGHPERALTHFLESQKQALRPDNFTISSLLKLSSDLKQPPLHGEHVHSFAIKSGHINDLFVRTGLINLYFSYGHFQAPHHLFDETPQRDVALFTAMVSGFSRNWLFQEALDILPRMQEERIKPNEMTISSILSVCSQLKLLTLGRILHGFSLRSGLLHKADVILETALVNMYVACRNLSYSRRVFDRMRERNPVSWDSMITCYSANGLFEKALQMFNDMVSKTPGQKPRSSTIVTVLILSGITTDHRKGKQIHGYILRRICSQTESDYLVQNNAIIDMYVKTGNLESSVSVFKSMARKSLVTWTSMISGYGIHGFAEKALKVFDEMNELGIKPDGVTFISLLSACSHGGLVDEGRGLYNSMEKEYNIVPEMKHFVCMVDLYGRAGLLKEAHDFIKGMAVEPSRYIWTTLLSSCRNHKNLELGEYAAKKASELDPYNVGIYLHLSRLYADKGQWEDVAKVRLVIKELGLRPETACSWVEMKGKVYKFTVGDQLKGLAESIYSLLEGSAQIMEKAGFFPDTTAVGHDVNEKEKISDLCGHTEKLALAFALIKSGGTSKKPILIGKNLRVCRDCHENFKFISKFYGLEIILKDPNRYHRFGQGQCSCLDFW